LQSREHRKKERKKERKLKKQRGVSHRGLSIKKDLNAKRRIMETQIFHHAKI
jgi:hypothetical protein